MREGGTEGTGRREKEYQWIAERVEGEWDRPSTVFDIKVTLNDGHHIEHDVSKATTIDQD